MRYDKILLAVVGLGYVGLPLALEFAKNRKVIAFDINSKRIRELNRGYDSNSEFSKRKLSNVKNIKFTNNLLDLSSCNIFIITVPTPVYKNKKPDLRNLKNASKSIGSILKKDDIVIYESTVYPGCTNDICIKYLEKYSKLYCNKDFSVGYSPERINPGDKRRTISKIRKIVSATNSKSLKIINKLYKEIINAGTYVVSEIKIAEAAKVIENTQRDLNIAFINELSIIFDKMNLSTNKVLEAANTKWNFLNFSPGLVGGHCIGVDPFYLTFKSKDLGYIPKVILSGRQTNDNMHIFLYKKLKKECQKLSKNLKDLKIMIMGYTFKENISDIRNTKVKDLFEIIFSRLSKNTFVYDPLIKNHDIPNMISFPKKKYYDVIIISVAHDIFKKTGYEEIKNYGKNNVLIFDIKNIFPKQSDLLRL